MICGIHLVSMAAKHYSIYANYVGYLNLDMAIQMMKNYPSKMMRYVASEDRDIARLRCGKFILRMIKAGANVKKPDGSFK